MSTTMDRRCSLKIIAGSAAFAATSSWVSDNAAAQSSPPTATAGPFKLPPLGYAYDALEPNIDAMTMNIHHSRHHQAFITNLNQLTQRWTELGTQTPEAILSNLDTVPENLRTAVRNNLGGHWNHSFFWELMIPGGAKQPSGDLNAAIEQAFGNSGQLIEKLNAAGLARFGSGWAWLILTKDKKLDVISTPNQDPPILEGQRAVLGVDVWEHAYYLKYQNRRGDYLKAWWNVVNWDKVSENFKKATI